MNLLAVSPFYRVAVKALVRDEHDRVLVIRNQRDEWEMPGGGWEHEEGFDACLMREIKEELGVGVTKMGAVTCVYTCAARRGYRALRILVPSELDSYDFKVEDGMQTAKFLSREEFLQTDFAPDEVGILDQIDKIWPIVE